MEQRDHREFAEARKETLSIERITGAQLALRRELYRPARSDLLRRAETIIGLIPALRLLFLFSVYLLLLLLFLLFVLFLELGRCCAVKKQVRRTVPRAATNWCIDTRFEASDIVLAARHGRYMLQWYGCLVILSDDPVAELFDALLYDVTRER